MGKLYYRDYSENTASSFKNSLLSKGFVIGSIDSVCDISKPFAISFAIYYKHNAKRSMLGCTEIGYAWRNYFIYSGDFNYFDIYLISTDGTDQPSDSDLHGVFGTVSGSQESALRAIIAVDNSNARDALSSYKAALTKSGFKYTFTNKGGGCYKGSRGLPTLNLHLMTMAIY
ncbi:MAG: hypothetical protein LBL65_00805 [Campylobacteraceae bacterium]|nr:hypothetical protein [Campylobacteraceae bacterium]